MFKKIWFILFFILILFSLLNISYFMWGEKDDYMFLFFDDNKIIDSSISNPVSTGSLAYVSNINRFDKIYHLENNSFTVKETGENIDISLDRGVFILDMNDISKEYKISYEWFDIRLQSLGSFYINTSSDNMLILSINSTIVVDFLSKEKDIFNSYFMYPHEFIRFNPLFNIKYKNTDLYRIRTITKNGYFKNRLLVDENNFNKNMLWNLIWSNNVDFFNSFLEYKKEILDNSIIINNKKQIEKYSYYFINDSKKIVVLHNSIYNDLIELYNLDVVNRDLIWKILKNLEDLKDLNSVEYNKSIKLIDNFYRTVLLNSSKISEHKVYNFIYLKL